MWSWRRQILSFFLLLILAGCRSQPATGELVIRTAAFTFPSLASVLPALIEEKGFDRAHGFTLETRRYGSVSTYYAALTTGDVDTLPGGPLVYRRMRDQGVPITVTNTYATLASLVVIAGDPAVQGLEDLRARKLAADMGSSEFLVLKLIAAHQGLDLERDIRVLQAVPSVARAHLATGEADAILTFEPTATLVLQDNPAFHIIAHGRQGWDQLGIGSGWLLVSLFRDNFLERSPEAAPAFAAALRDAAELIKEDPSSADEIVARKLDLGSGIFRKAVDEGRIQFDIRMDADVSTDLQRMFEAAQTNQ